MTSNNNNLEISLITPMFNEEGEIKKNIDRIIITMEELGKDWEYILIMMGLQTTLMKSH